MKHIVTQKQLLAAQQNEITEHYIYAWLAEHTKDAANREVLERIAKDEKAHYEVLRGLTQMEIKPQKFRVLRYKIICRVLGISFGLRLMERGEQVGEDAYGKLQETQPEVADLFLDEQRHENEILGLIKEERIEYAGSIVLGLNDALMELTGALAGLTLALQNSRLIAMTGFITGIAASMSMAASGFLSAREEADENTTKSPLKAAAYTGVAYIITVLILITPYLVLSNVYLSAAVMLCSSVLIILSYNFYITTAKGLPMWRRFIQMAAISLGVAGISFVVGITARLVFGVEM
jgi:VIT1/CCC1 family predicted Fe2+/Mn2+ transporter